MMFDTEVVDQHLEDVNEPRVEGKNPAIMYRRPARGRVFIEGQQRGFVTLDRFRVVSRKRKLDGYQKIAFGRDIPGLPEFLFVLSKTDVETRHDGFAPCSVAANYAALSGHARGVGLLIGVIARAHQRPARGVRKSHGGGVAVEFPENRRVGLARG